LIPTAARSNPHGPREFVVGAAANDAKSREFPHSAGDDPDTVVAEFNSRYMVVNEHGKTWIYSRVRDEARGRDRFERISFADFHRLYMNRLVPVGFDDSGDPVLKPASHVWLTSPRRRQYIGGVTFRPGVELPPNGEFFNLWTGFARKPRPGDWSRMREHILSVICRGNQEHFNYLMGWLANLFQNPGRQGEVAVVLKGPEGVGKGVLGKMVRSIVGQHAMAINNPRHLVGNFNAHLRDCVFLFADEAFFAGDARHTAVLKSLITEDSIPIPKRDRGAELSPHHDGLERALGRPGVARGAPVLRALGRPVRARPPRLLRRAPCGDGGGRLRGHAA
jgi:Family of unknown function (DUF5906)